MSDPSPSLRPGGPWRAYDLMLADLETGQFEGPDLPGVGELAARYGVEPDDVVGARYLLAADNRLRLLDPRPNYQRWGVGPSGPDDPRYDIVTAIQRIREDKARDDADPLKLDVYRVAPSREKLAERYGVTEHSVREAAELEYPGLPYGSPTIELDAFAGFTKPSGARQLQPAVVAHFKQVIAGRSPRERLPLARLVTPELGLDDPRLVARAYDALVADGTFIRANNVGTFLAHKSTAPPPTRKPTGRDLRKRLGEGLDGGQFPGGALPTLATLTHLWRADGLVVNPPHLARVLRELEEEGSARREGVGGGTKWFIDTVPALAPPVKRRKATAPLNTVEDVADVIEARIVTGEYPPGYRLPTDAELAEEFDVAPQVGREALHVLAFDDLVAAVLFRDSAIANHLPGRYVAPVGGDSHAAHLAAAPVLERITSDLAAGSFAGEIPCDPDTIWPTAGWFAAKYGVPEKLVHTALMVCGRRGLGANLRRDPRYSVPAAAFDPGDNPPSRRSPTWTAGRLEQGLLKYPQKGLRLPTRGELQRRLGVAHTTVQSAIAELSGRLADRQGQQAGYFTTAGTPTAPKPPSIRRTPNLNIVLTSPARARSLPHNLDRWGRVTPAGWEGGDVAWAVHYADEVGSAAKQALLLAAAEGTLTGDVLRDNADVALRGIRQAVADAKSTAERDPHTRSRFRGEARQLWAILEGVAPYLGGFSADTIRGWIGDGGIPYAFHTKTPMPPAMERDFLVDLYKNVESCFAGAVEFVDRPAGVAPRTAIAQLGGKAAGPNRSRVKGTAK